MSLVSDRSGASKRHIEDTKRLYSTIISKQLDEKQLVRPSFEFIQDLVKNLISETRILRDVFNPNDFEMIGGGGQQVNTSTKTNSKRRQTSQDIKKAKVEFVQKLINFAANNKQPVIGCVASKIIAGLEPNKTNELLQSLARICQAKLGAAGSSNNARNSSASGERPRTFTRQLPDSGAASGRRSSYRKSSSEVGALSSAESKSTKAISKKNNVINNIAKQQQRPQPQQVKKELSVAATTSSEQNASAAPTPSKQPAPQLAREPIQPIKTPAKTTPTIEKPRQRCVSSESDIGKEMNHVRAHLKLIRSTLTDIIKQEATLRDDLLISIQTANNNFSSSYHQVAAAAAAANH